MSYEDIVRDNLEHSPLIRHLFARLNKEITVQTVGEKITGILNAIDIVQKFIEVEAVRPTNDTYFIGLRHVIWIKAKNFPEISVKKNEMRV
jgi:hypothetical protein